MSLYIIVKNAQEPYWESYFLDNPNTHPVHLTHSVYYTHTGKQFCQLYYKEKEKSLADIHCAQLNKINPSGNYAVVSLLESSLTNT